MPEIVPTSAKGTPRRPPFGSSVSVLAAAICLAVLAAGHASGQGRPYYLERLPAVDSEPFAAPQFVTSPPATDLFVSQPGEGDSDSIEQRLAALEAELKKSKAAEAKKKEDDALKPIVKPRGRLHTDINWLSQSELTRDVYGDIQNGT
jgi:hypothetical protein